VAAARLGVRLLAVDRPGFGQSTFQPCRRIGGSATDIGALADQLALPRLSIIGVSGGGPYALACTARLAHRLHRVALVVRHIGEVPADLKIDSMPSATTAFAW
jgi:pimeloyl-ACP methyl ester carboxylesterase